MESSWATRFMIIPLLIGHFRTADDEESGWGLRYEVQTMVHSKYICILLLAVVDL
ncbi:hypothetical protein D3C79_1027020 [compost metagenome]